MKATDDRAEAGAEAGAEPGAVTIAYIAESAGVSIPTVSKVLNRRGGVSDQTRARVEELITLHGYRKPVGNRSNVVELVFRELDSLWAVEVIRGVERAARKHRAVVMVSEVRGDGPPGRSIGETAGRRPNCVLAVNRLSPEEREQLTAAGIPFVIIDPLDDLPDEVPFVGSTGFRGGQAAMRHLLDLGHRRIAMIIGTDQPVIVPRQSGFLAALAQDGLTPDPELLAVSPFTREGGRAAALELLALPERPTAFVTVSDPQALGVYQAAGELRLSVPRDLSVVGFDDLPIASWAEPPLTTVHQPLNEMAAAATELALALGRREEVQQGGTEIATTLTVRGSTARPKR
jgi:DNA-binding LacI/PurR family transcriptional regulator